MSDGTTSIATIDRVITGVQRRRRWTPKEKVRIVEETYLPGMSISLITRRHDIGGNQILTSRRLIAQDALTAAAAGEEVVPASDYRALEAQVRELHRLLGKKAMENELLREVVPRAAGPKKRMARPVRKVIPNGMRSLHQRIRSQGFSPGPRWVPRAPILINCAVPSTTFLARISKRRFDRYANFCH
ncbi:transposase [Sphingomonas sp. H160509]|uniref:transposase n=1 Tax=Sphingomonas sp. H160509 TaxID=2955313 RepID=UPI002097E49E|nr:transposase [Sphingomonas sp. H160509]MDD1453154.1 transposase [Sphingomonas sp. H160509]